MIHLLMNYFELFDVPVSMKLDATVLQQKFYQLSRSYHPDFYSTASAQTQAEILEKSSFINKAYSVLTNPDLLIEYVLMHHQIIDADEKYQLPNQFLMEMMDLNEAVMEAIAADDIPAKVKLQTTITNITNELYQLVQTIIENYSEPTITKEALLQVKEYFYKKKYLARILESLQ